MVKRCPKGTYKNNKNGNCEKKITNEIIRKRCPKGTHKNKNTGNCDKISHSIKINNLVETPETNFSYNVVSRENYEYIKDKYGHMSSWAIWSEQNGNIKSGMGDISFFENPTISLLKLLNPNIVLVGLNISKEIPRVFGNFHPDYSSAQDYKTRYAVKDTIFWGAYMTDIIKDFSEMVSGNMMKYLSKNKTFEKENIKTFEQELSDIGSTNPIIIALGNDSYKILKRNLNEKYKIYKVSHYSAYITKEKLRLEFEKLGNEKKL